MDEVQCTLDMAQYTLFSMSIRLACFIVSRKYKVAKEIYTSSFWRRLGVRISISLSEKKSFSLLKTFRIRAGKLI